MLYRSVYFFIYPFRHISSLLLGAESYLIELRDIAGRIDPRPDEGGALGLDRGGKRVAEVPFCFHRAPSAPTSAIDAAERHAARIRRMAGYGITPVADAPSFRPYAILH
jgi:hypothetical protein